MVLVKGINSKHFKTGDAFPASTPGLLRIYAQRFCPFSERTVLAILAKEIPAEVINCNLKRKPEWFLEKNSSGTTPTIEFDGKVIFDSAICSQYLDDANMGRNIMPSDPFLKAQQRMKVERMSGLFSGFVAFLFKRKSDEESFAEITEQLVKAELILGDDKYFGGEQCGFADHQVWPFFERILALPIISQGKFTVDKIKLSKLWDYIERMKIQPEVKAFNLPTESIAQFCKAYSTGEEPNYDMLIDA